MPGIARSVGGKPQKIEIRGHTSAKPVTGAFQDKWDLAYARSRRVMEALVAAGVAPHRCRLAVAAANEPSQVLEDASLLQAISRVETIMLDELVSDFLGSPQDLEQRVQMAPGEAP